MGLGPVFDFDAPPPGSVDESGKQDGGAASPYSENVLRNGLIFSGIAALFLIFACYICKRRRDEAARNSGSQQAKRQRKHLPLTEEDPNNSLLESSQNQNDDDEANFVDPSTLKFVGAEDSDDE